MSKDKKGTKENTMHKETDDKKKKKKDKKGC